MDDITKVEDSQFGDNSLNVGKADFRGAKITIGDNTNNTIQTEQPDSIWDLNPIRKKLWNGKGVNRRKFLNLSGVGSLASIISLFISISITPPDWLIVAFSMLFSTLFLIPWGVAFNAKNLIFQVLPGDIGLEFRPYDNMLFFTRINGKCPICGESMYLKNIGRKRETKTPYLICGKNFRQHRFEFDFTTLPEID